MKNFIFIFVLSIIFLLPKNAFAEDAVEIPQEQYISVEKAYDKLVSDGVLNNNFKYGCCMRIKNYKTNYLTLEDGVYFFFYKEKFYNVSNRIANCYITGEHFMELNAIYCFYDENNYVNKSIFGNCEPYGMPISMIELLDTTHDVCYWSDNSKVFFQVPPVPPVVKPVTELEKAQQKIQQQIIPIMKPKVTKSLDFLVPLGIGLMACLIGVVILPKVLRKFLN